jgi:hypothetical protein
MRRPQTRTSMSLTIHQTTDAGACYDESIGMCLVLIFTSNKSTGLFYAVSLLSKRIIRRVIAHTTPCHQHTSRHVVTPTAPRHHTRHVNTHTAPCHQHTSRHVVTPTAPRHHTTSSHTPRHHIHRAMSTHTPRHVITHIVPRHHTHRAMSSHTLCHVITDTASRLS